jgi:hypothetical protein
MKSTYYDKTNGLISLREKGNLMPSGGQDIRSAERAWLPHDWILKSVLTIRFDHRSNELEVRQHGGGGGQVPRKVCHNWARKDKKIERTDGSKNE